MNALHYSLGNKRINVRILTVKWPRAVLHVPWGNLSTSMCHIPALIIQSNAWIKAVSFEIIISDGLLYFPTSYTTTRPAIWLLGGRIWDTRADPSCSVWTFSALTGSEASSDAFPVLRNRLNPAFSLCARWIIYAVYHGWVSYRPFKAYNDIHTNAHTF